MKSCRCGTTNFHKICTSLFLVLPPSLSARLHPSPPSRPSSLSCFIFLFIIPNPLGHGLAFKCLLRGILDSNPSLTWKMAMDNTAVTGVCACVVACCVCVVCVCVCDLMSGRPFFSWQNFLWTELSFGKLGWSLVRYNDTAHLFRFDSSTWTEFII